MQVKPDHVVSMHYKLTSADGDVIDSSEGRDPLSYLHGHGNIIAGLEKELEGKAEGEKASVDVAAKEAYGEHDPELIVDASKEQFPEDVELKEGMTFQAQTPQGSRIVKIDEIEEETVKVDTNHPLAGMDLHFDVEIVEVREASSEELEHGHVH